MIGKDEDQDEVSFRVTDRRKFNPDGSVKEGVVIEPEPSRPALNNDVLGTVEEAEPLPSAPTQEPIPSEAEALPEQLTDDVEDLPGAEDPASFVNFLSTLATNAAASLGAAPHPATGKRSLDLETGKYWLDILAMLRDKTKGNLREQESRLLDGLLADLRMQYVTMVRATEEKLKADAAQRFSGADILGKK